MEDALIMWADLGSDDADNPEFAGASEGEQA
jgi:hypothetical protein